MAGAVPDDTSEPPSPQLQAVVVSKKTDVSKSAESSSGQVGNRPGPPFLFAAHPTSPALPA